MRFTLAMVRLRRCWLSSLLIVAADELGGQVAPLRLEQVEALVSERVVTSAQILYLARTRCRAFPIDTTSLGRLGSVGASAALGDSLRRTCERLPPRAPVASTPRLEENWLLLFRFISNSARPAEVAQPWHRFLATVREQEGRVSGSMASLNGRNETTNPTVTGNFSCALDGRLCGTGRMRLSWDNQDWQVFEFQLDSSMRSGSGRAEVTTPSGERHRYTFAICARPSGALRCPGDAAIVAAPPPGVLEIRVVNEADQSPLSGGQVTIVGTTYGTMTDGRGIAKIVGVRPGAYQVRVRLIGYRVACRDVSVASGATASATMELRKADVDLSSVVVTDRGRAQPRRDTTRAPAPTSPPSTSTCR